MEYKSKGSFLGWFVGLAVPVQEIFILPWLLYSAWYTIFFSSPHTFNCVPNAEQPGQAVVLGRLSLNMYICSHLTGTKHTYIFVHIVYCTHIRILIMFDINIQYFCCIQPDRNHEKRRRKKITVFF